MLYDWAYLERADLDADESNPGLTGTWTRGLLIRRTLGNGECAFFTTWCPAGTSVDTLVAVEGQLRDRQERVRPRPQREPVLARLAPPCLAGHAGVCHDGEHSPPREPAGPFENDTPPDLCAPSLIRWSLQEIRRVATRLAQQRIHPAHVIAWSLWRRAHQATAQRSHLKRDLQL